MAKKSIKCGKTFLTQSKMVVCADTPTAVHTVQKRDLSLRVKPPADSILPPSMSVQLSRVRRIDISSITSDDFLAKGRIQA